MNDQLAKQLVKQLKILNFWVTSLGVLLLAGLVVIGILLFQVISFVRDTSHNITNFTTSTQQKLDLKTQACAGNDSFSTFIKSKTDVCR